jgi:serpin B
MMSLGQFLGWAVPPVPAEPQGAERVSAAAKAAAASTERFGIALYEQLAAANGNLFFSPSSISSCLAMAYAGARGVTAEEMAKTLCFASGPGLHEGFRDLMALLLRPHRPGKEAPILHIANALWCQDGFPLVDDYLQLMQHCYAAGLKRLDLAGQPEQARRTINAWVEQQTKDRIKDLLKPGAMQPDTRLVLTNAIYLKATWQFPFRAEATLTEDFFTAPDRPMPTRFMRQTNFFDYHETELAQIVALPYAGDELVMVVVLPRRKDGLPEVEKTFTRQPVWLSEQFKHLKPAKVNLVLPKFQSRSSFDLTGTLKAMGMNLAFAPLEADFTGMSTAEPLYIGLVVHQAFVAVDEKGTEAAAATATTTRAGSAAPRPEQIVTFRADHPFLYLIMERQTGAMLFLGRLSEPERAPDAPVK